MRDRLMMWVVLSWCTCVIVICGYLAEKVGTFDTTVSMLTSVGTSMSENAMKEIILGMFGVISLGISSYLTYVMKKVDNSVNNRHHYAKDEDGEPLPGPDGKPVKLNLVDMAMNNHDKLVLIGVGVKETNRLANENRDLIIGVQDEQARVKDELKQLRSKGCDKISECHKDG